jgi:hypothetical protein
MYSLILTIILGTVEVNMPITHIIPARDEKHCHEMLDKIEVYTPIPILQAKASCQKNKDA